MIAGRRGPVEGEHPAHAVPGDWPRWRINPSDPATRSRTANYADWPRSAGDEPSGRYPPAGRTGADHPRQADPRLPRPPYRGRHAAGSGTYGPPGGEERDWCRRLCGESGAAEGAGCRTTCPSGRCPVSDTEFLDRFLTAMEATGHCPPGRRGRVRALVADPVAAGLVGRLVRSAPGPSEELYRYVCERIGDPVPASYAARVAEGLARLEERLVDQS